MLDPDQTLGLAERVALAAERLGIRTALIGAAALAVHGYARGTEDVDLATVVGPDTGLRAVAGALADAGLETELRLPDEDDPLGGVLVIRGPGGDSDVVEVVNFLNPLRPRTNPAAMAIARAYPLEGVQLRCVALADLVALKLYAGSRSDLADIVQLLARNPDADPNALRSIAGPFDRSGCLESLISEARALR